MGADYFRNIFCFHQVQPGVAYRTYTPIYQRCKFPTPGPAKVRVPYVSALPTTRHRRITGTRTVPYETQK